MKASKRALDLIAALAGLVLLAPVFLALGFAIRWEDGGHVFFRQVRVGLRGRPFLIWKFRTMVTDAERRGGPLTVGEDPRITRTGRWLRRWKLDELPQLLNVIQGTMSLVGPRPEVPRYVKLYTIEERRVLELVPGITDPASIAYRDENRLLATVGDPEGEYIRTILPEKIRLNLAYAARANVLSDLRVLLQTLGLGRLWPAGESWSGGRLGSPAGKSTERRARPTSEHEEV